MFRQSDIKKAAGFSCYMIILRLILLFALHFGYVSNQASLCLEFIESQRYFSYSDPDIGRKILDAKDQIDYVLIFLITHIILELTSLAILCCLILEKYTLPILKYIGIVCDKEMFGIFNHAIALLSMINYVAYIWECIPILYKLHTFHAVYPDDENENDVTHRYYKFLDPMYISFNVYMVVFYQHLTSFNIQKYSFVHYSRNNETEDMLKKMDKKDIEIAGNKKYRCKYFEVPTEKCRIVESDSFSSLQVKTEDRTITDISAFSTSIAGSTSSINSYNKIK